MTSTFAADVRKWSGKAKRNARLVVMEASEGVYNAMTERQASVQETGGAFVVGKVPVDVGHLIGSVVVSVGGLPVRGEQNAPPDYMAVISGFKAGTPIEAAFTADYAPAMNYGTANMAGRFFVTNAVAQWPAFVATAAARYKGG